MLLNLSKGALHAHEDCRRWWLGRRVVYSRVHHAVCTNRSCAHTCGAVRCPPFRRRCHTAATAKRRHATATRRPPVAVAWRWLPCRARRGGEVHAETNSPPPKRILNERAGHQPVTGEEQTRTMRARPHVHPVDNDNKQKVTASQHHPHDAERDKQLRHGDRPPSTARRPTPLGGASGTTGPRYAPRTAQANVSYGTPPTQHTSLPLGGTTPHRSAFLPPASTPPPPPSPPTPSSLGAPTQHQMLGPVGRPHVARTLTADDPALALARAEERANAARAAR